jgi:hypothetical protein
MSSVHVDTNGCRRYVYIHKHKFRYLFESKNGNNIKMPHKK